MPSASAGVRPPEGQPWSAASLPAAYESLDRQDDPAAGNGLLRKQAEMDRAVAAFAELDTPMAKQAAKRRLVTLERELAQLTSMGVDPTSVESMELVAGDDVIARADKEQLGALLPQTNFTIPSHNHGKVKVNVSAELQAKAQGTVDRDALVSAVLLYKSTTPRTTRELVTISEDTDLSVQLAAVDDGREKPGHSGH